MGLFNGVYLLSLALAVSGAQAERWRWPSGESGLRSGAGAGAEADARAEQSVRIDTKVRFIDSSTPLTPDRNANVQRDEPTFEPAADTSGFYNRPPGAARYPLHSRGQRADPPPQHRNEASDGTLDALQYCRCEGSADCIPRSDYNNACGAGRYLCCYSRRGEESPRASEIFNEVDDERLRRYPGRGALARPFPPPAHAPPAPPAGGPAADGSSRPVLTGPQGPSGVIGPFGKNNNGDSGESESAQRGVLIGPGRATGIIGPSYNRPILVGPGGPTGIVGPRRQGVLVGPGGPTGIIGPRRQGVLVGPDGPTGRIGPAGIYRSSGGPGILVGPGGPTGTIGPGRQILVGPGGPTGQIGPRGGYGK